MADKVTDVAKKEADHVRAVATEAVRSGAYFYPIKANIPMTTTYAPRLTRR